jgi:hypothetical protein
MAKSHGQFGRVFLSTSGAGVASPLVGVNKWSLDRKTDTAEVTAFEDTNKTYVQGKPDVSGAFSGFWDDANDSIFLAADSTTPVKVYLYPNFITTPTAYHYGTAWISASLDTDANGAVSISGTFMAATSWSRKP